MSLTIDGDMAEIRDRYYDQTIRVTIICYTRDKVIVFKTFTAFNIKGDIEMDMPIASEDYRYYAQMICIAEYDAIVMFQDYARKEQVEISPIAIRHYDRILADVKANKFKLNN